MKREEVSSVDPGSNRDTRVCAECGCDFIEQRFPRALRWVPGRGFRAFAEDYISEWVHPVKKRCRANPFLARGGSCG